MTTDRAYVYLLANGFKRLYTGVTARLPERIREHKLRIHPTCFTARYHIDQLVYFETHRSIVEAIAREKQIKGWLRIKKVQLIVASNPTWRDLSLDLLSFPEFKEKTESPLRILLSTHPSRLLSEAKNRCNPPSLLPTQNPVS